MLKLPMPTLQCVLRRITQLADGRPHPFAKLDVELDRSNPVFVRIHVLPPGSPSFRPHPRWVRIRWKSTTYIATDEGWLYLAAVIDLFGRQVEGWSLQPHMQSSLVKDALAMASWRRRPAAGLIFHSARGIQYCSGELQPALRSRGMRSSMSRKGNCWSNAPTESFWGRLKTACVHGHKFATREEAMRAVMGWMAFYNHRRLHSSLGYLSPMQFAQRWYEAQRKKCRVTAGLRTTRNRGKVRAAIIQSV
jgi:transposase InsO family protein